MLLAPKERNRSFLQTLLLSNPVDLDSKVWAENPYFHNSKDLKVKPNYILCLGLLISIICLKLKNLTYLKNNMVKSKTIACNFIFSEEKCVSEMTLFIIPKVRDFFCLFEVILCFIYK